MFYRDKLCVVAGGSGFVGTHVVRALLAEGARVRVPVHRRPMIERDPRIEIVEADLTDQEQCRRAFAGASCVFHCAGPVGAAGVGPIAAMDGMRVNLTLTAGVLEAAWVVEAERILIYGSSTGYPPLDRPVREEDMWTGEPHPSYFGYGWMRRYEERLGEYVHRESRTGVVVVRPTAIYGRHDNFDPRSCHFVPALIRKAVTGLTPFEIWGTGNETRDLMHVEDFARGSLLALERSSGFDPVNIGAGRSVSVRDVAEIVLDAAGHKAPLVFASDKPTKIPNRSVDVTRAREVLGFAPRIDLRDGLFDTVAWYKAQQTTA